MDINHGDRRRLWLSRRTIGCLLLVILWSFEVASREAGAVWRPVNKISTYVSSVPISKDVIILNHQKENAFTARICNDFIKFPLIYQAYSTSFFSWPICCSAGSGINSAIGDDTIYSVLQIYMICKDNCIATTIATFTRAYGRSEPIVLNPVADHLIRFNYASGVRGQFAVFDTRTEFEAIEYGANIGTELTLLSIDSGVGLRAGGISEPTRVYRSPKQRRRRQRQ